MIPFVWHGNNPRAKKKAARRTKNFFARQKRLSGSCKTIYGRDQGVGTIPENLTPPPRRRRPKIAAGRG